MYPEWPRSTTDLVPLPRCEGPKLQAFPFQGGVQQIDFLGFLGQGFHAYVVKVRIHDRIHAMKCFRFCSPVHWCLEIRGSSHCDIMNAFYNYSDPFNCECRAFGRLRETRHEELAVQCFGYVLLDEDHERVLKEHLNAQGVTLTVHNHRGVENSGECMRQRFHCSSGREAPIRCIVKEFGSHMDDMKARDVKRIHQDVVSLQQLGIIRLDVAQRQIINGKLSDFSLAITTPHFQITQLLSRFELRAAYSMYFGAFQMAIADYFAIDKMVSDWNKGASESGKARISFRSISDTNYRVDRARYNLRNTPSRQCLYTLVDPRRYD